LGFPPPVRLHKIAAVAPSGRSFLKVDHLFPTLLPRDRLAGPAVVVVPHPDDEVIGCGGVLAHHAGRGDRTVVVHATDGAGGDPEGRYGDVVRRRREESAAALAVLGVTEVRELGFADGELAAAAGLTEAVAAILAAENPATLYLLSPFESHRDHRVLAAASARAAAACDPDTECMVFGINNLALPNTLVDITDLLERKERALRCYASQLAYIDFATKVVWRDKAATVNIEDREVVACEAFMRLPAGRLAALGRAAAGLENLLYGS
jgi:LmbE family N-acetylglucosaminyl deacetylase